MPTLKYGLFISLAALLLTGIAQANDVEHLLDYMNELNQTDGGVNYYSHTGFQGLTDAMPLSKFTVMPASVYEFQGLYGQSLSSALLQFPVSSVNPLHYHLHGAEFLYVLEGSLEVGFVEKSNKLYTQILQKGDMFVFPKELIHYQQHHGTVPAVALLAYGSSLPETILIPEVLFASGIKNNTLAKSFNTDIATIKKLKAGLVPTD